MAWSKKLKRKMKKRVLGTLAILTLTCTLFVSGKILTIPTLIKQTTKTETQYALTNSVDITRIGNQTAVQVTGVNPDGVNSIQVLQENKQIASYNYDGSSNFEKEKVAVNIPFGESTNIKVKVNGNTVLAQNVENLRYVGTAQELKKFADLVNAGDIFEGRIVELTADIDLSTVCSKELGSWESIGECDLENYSVSFAGVFNGNYHKIKNLYIDNDYTNNKKLYVGLFGKNDGVIENVILENIFINQTGVNKDKPIAAAGIAVANWGVITNCGIESGSINVVNNATSTTKQYREIVMGGITSWNRAYIANCYNKASLLGNNYRINCVEAFVGGIAGSSGAEQGAEVYNCYNTGEMHGSAYHTMAGGILGRLHHAKSIVANSYSTGNVTEVHNLAGYAGGIVGQNGWNTDAVSQKGNIENSYCTTNTDYSYRYFANGKESTSKAGRLEAETLKGYASTLGDENWIADTYGINNGYPILKWQIPVRYELSEKQVYLKQGETLQLKIDDSSTDEALGSITWKSADNSIAKVDSTGKVTAVSEGVTTVYSTESKYGIQAMCIINVAKSGTVAISQAYTSNPKNVFASSVILKEDGTVWSTGDNQDNQLGDGTNLSSKEPVQVKINSTTYLTDVVKIATGNYHTLALTSTGEVYAWGCNDKGEIGVGSNDRQYYATKVLTPDGQGYLKNIVDISADRCGSKALNADGYVYSWGLNSFGQLGNGNTDNKSTPIITKGIDNVISIQNGEKCTQVLTQSGNIYTWGDNQNTILGLGTTTASYYIPQKTNMENIVKISSGMFNFLAKDTSGTIYVTGKNDWYQLANGTTTNAKNYTPLNLPSAVSATNKVKDVKAYFENIEVLLEDGTIWIVGNNKSGQMSIGNDLTTHKNYVQALDSNGNAITNAKYLANSAGYRGDGTYVVTAAYIADDGYVYSAGNNAQGQFGNGTTKNSLYYTQMGVPYLNCEEKSITIKPNETYQIDKSKFSIKNEFNVRIDFTPTPVGDLTYEAENPSIVTVDETGLVTGIAEGFTKIIVTDNTNNYQTEIQVKILNDIEQRLELGSKFSIGLRTNGDIYTWGSNTYGELGIGSTNYYADQPQKVTTLSNIEDIGAGYYHAIALKDDGTVYTWGSNYHGQLGDGATNNSNVPIKVNGLSNIVRVDAYKHTSIALDSNGNVYVWGEGYGNTPTKVPGLEDIIAISGNLALGKDGKIKTLENHTIHNLNGVKKISCGENMSLALIEGGQVVGINADGTLTTYSGVSDIVEIAAGNDYYLLMDKNQTVYSFGINDTYQLANGGNKTVNTPTPISTTNIETIAASEGGHTALADFDGNIYTVGLNDKGQLGHRNTDNLKNLKLLLNIILDTSVNEITEGVGESKNVKIDLGINLNLKKDLNQDSTKEVSIANENIAKLSINSDGTYKVTGVSLGRTFLNVTIKANVNGKDEVYTKKIEIKIVPEGGIVVPKVDSGKGFTVALKADGTVWTWGQNQYGQLGIGNTISQNEPQKVEIVSSITKDEEGNNIENTEPIIDIAVGNYQVLALGQSGKVYSWGRGTEGQCRYRKYKKPNKTCNCNK